MKYYLPILTMIVIYGSAPAQDIETILLKFPLSKYDTIFYQRTIQFNKNSSLYLVNDYFENGQIEMEASYSALDKYIKEGFWCNYRTNTKEGFYKKWFRNGI